MCYTGLCPNEHYDGDCMGKEDNFCYLEERDRCYSILFDYLKIIEHIDNIDVESYDLYCIASDFVSEHLSSSILDFALYLWQNDSAIYKSSTILQNEMKIKAVDSNKSFYKGVVIKGKREHWDYREDFEKRRMRPTSASSDIEVARKFASPTKGNFGVVLKVTPSKHLENRLNNHNEKEFICFNSSFEILEIYNEHNVKYGREAFNYLKEQQEIIAELINGGIL